MKLVRLRRIVAMIGLCTLAVIGPTATAAHADAGDVPSRPICIVVYDSHGQSHVECFTFGEASYPDYAYDEDWCLPCGAYLTITTTDPGRPDQDVLAAIGHLGRGLGLLSTGAGDKASGEFRAAAILLGGGLQPGAVGLTDGVKFGPPTPEPALVAADQHLVAGLTLAVKDEGAAMREFKQALAGLLG